MHLFLWLFVVNKIFTDRIDIVDITLQEIALYLQVLGPDTYVQKKSKAYLHVIILKEKIGSKRPRKISNISDVFLKHNILLIPIVIDT